MAVSADHNAAGYKDPMSGDNYIEHPPLPVLNDKSNREKSNILYNWIKLNAQEKTLVRRHYQCVADMQDIEVELDIKESELDKFTEAHASHKRNFLSNYTKVAIRLGAQVGIVVGEGLIDQRATLQRLAAETASTGVGTAGRVIAQREAAELAEELASAKAVVDSAKAKLTAMRTQLVTALNNHANKVQRELDEIRQTLANTNTSKSIREEFDRKMAWFRNAKRIPSSVITEEADAMLARGAKQAKEADARLANLRRAADQLSEEVSSVTISPARELDGSLVSRIGAGDWKKPPKVDSGDVLIWHGTAKHGDLLDANGFETRLGSTKELSGTYFANNEQAARAAMNQDADQSYLGSRGLFSSLIPRDVWNELVEKNHIFWRDYSSGHTKNLPGTMEYVIKTKEALDIVSRHRKRVR